MDEIMQLMAQSVEYSHGFTDAKSYLVKQITTSLDRLKFNDAKSIYANAYNLAIDHAKALLDVYKK